MLASPLYSLQVYDRVLTSRNVGTLLMLTLIVGVFLILYGLLDRVHAIGRSRPRRERPRRSAAEHSDELAPFQLRYSR
jgi:hypothetical protein